MCIRDRAYSAPDLLAGFKGPISKRRGEEGKGKGRKGIGKGRSTAGNGREGENLAPKVFFWLRLCWRWKRCYSISYVTYRPTNCSVLWRGSLISSCESSGLCRYALTCHFAKYHRHHHHHHHHLYSSGNNTKSSDRELWTGQVRQ